MRSYAACSRGAYQFVLERQSRHAETTGTVSRRLERRLTERHRESVAIVLISGCCYYVELASGASYDATTKRHEPARPLAVAVREAVAA